MFPLTDRQKAIMVFRFLMSPHGDARTKQETLDHMAESPDKQSYRIAQYMADPTGNYRVKQAIITMMELSPEELRLCTRLVLG